MGPVHFVEILHPSTGEIQHLFLYMCKTEIFVKYGEDTCHACCCWFIVSFCHFILLIFSPRDDPVEGISAELLNWKEAALIGCSVGAVLKAAGWSTLCHAERLC